MELLTAMDIPDPFGVAETFQDSKYRHFKTPCFNLQEPKYDCLLRHPQTKWRWLYTATVPKCLGELNDYAFEMCIVYI